MSDSPQLPDPALWRGMTSSRFSRRSVLGLAGAAGGAALLSACGGIQAQGKKASTSKSAVDKYWAAQKPTGELVWANWPLYIDTKGKADHPSLDQFMKKSGVKVTYQEAVQDNGPFFAKVQPSLSAGQYCGYDLAVISSGIFFNKFKDLGFLVPLDQSRLTNFHKYAGTKYQNESFDPGNVFSIPWQAGFTGIGYNPKYTGKKITSWQDLNDPKLKGHIGLFANNEDLPNCALLAIGVDPLKSTESDWRKAAKWLDDMKPLVRNFYSQNYIQGLATGDLWASMAWSGDIFQQNLSGKAIGQELKFVIPEEGGLLWTDNFLILKGAKNPVSAMELMDFYYQPKIAAEVTEWVNYISPGPDARAVVEKDAAAAKGGDKKYLDQIARSFATFPDEATYAKTTIGLTPKEGKQLDTWNSIFEPVYQS
ncbi:MAG TPA: spermidine/putrescine ABC transporter substrate-binding protein [Solirubrobacterales bacterium]|nr:spermidine/putrescine ABC transporter substrate-binding protein [Solirubrobacterales bacterium]